MIAIKARGAGEEVNLSARIVTKDFECMIALGISVPRRKWDDIDITLKQLRKSFKRGATIIIDDQLTAKLWEVQKALIIQESTGQLTQASARNIIYGLLYSEAYEKAKQIKKSVKASIKPTLSEFLLQYLDERKNGTRLKNGTTKKIADNTFRIEYAVVKLISEYNKDNHVVLDWEDMTFDWLRKFKVYCIDQNLSPNTIAVYVCTLKTILNAAHNLHYTATTDFLSKDWRSEKEESENIYVTKERISQLYQLNLSDRDSLLIILKKNKTITETDVESFVKDYYASPRSFNRLSRARDMFVLGCLIGQRYSDLKGVNLSSLISIMRKKFLSLTQQKTGKNVFIPVNDIILTILQNYPKGFLCNDPTIFNRDIRTLAALCGWTEVPGINKRRGNLMINHLRFCDLISSHTCRRSFATNAYKDNIPLSAIMAVTGHSSEAMLRKYLKLNSEEKALEAAKAFAKVNPFLYLAK